MLFKNKNIFCNPVKDANKLGLSNPLIREALNPMPNHLMSPLFYLAIRMASVGVAAIGLASCAATPHPPSPSVPQAVSPAFKNIMVTVNEIQMAEHRAYDDGFAAGRAYQREHCAASLPAATTPAPLATPAADAATTGLTDTVKPKVDAAPSLKPEQKATSATPQASTPLKTLTTGTPVYSTSGPAQKLSP